MRKRVVRKVFQFPVAKFEKVLNQSGIARLLQETSPILNQLMAAASQIYLKLHFCQLVSYICRGPTEDIIHYFTLMSSELHYLDIIPKIGNLH